MGENGLICLNCGLGWVRLLGPKPPNLARCPALVVAIEESKDLSTMNKEELQSSLKAHKQRMEEMNVDKIKVEIALSIRFVGRDKKVKVAHE